MNNLDEKILILFHNLINFGNKYLLKDSLSSYINYKIGDYNIVIQFIYDNLNNQINEYSSVDSKSSYFLNSIIVPNTSSITGFYLIVNGKPYVVPELSRVELAETLDKLDFLLRNRENTVLDNLIQTLNSDEEF